MSDDSEVLNTIVEAGTLKTGLDVLQTLVDEAIIHLGKHGIRVSCVDPANAAMHAPMEIDAAAFEHVPEGSFAIGVNLERLDDALGKAGASELVDLSFKHETRRLNVSYGNVSVDLACIDPDTIRKEPDRKELDLPNEFTVPVKEWKDALDMADLVSDHVAIECQPDAKQVVVRAEGDIDNVTVTFEREEILDAKIAEGTESLFSLEYLQLIQKGMPGGEVAITCGQEFPILLEYEFAEGNGSVTTMLAPRIET